MADKNSVSGPDPSAGATAAPGGAGSPNAVKKKVAPAFKGIRAMGRAKIGVFRMAEALFGWKRDEDNKFIYKAEQIVSCTWVQIGPQDSMLEFLLKGEALAHFSGFRNEHQKEITKYMRDNWQIELAKRDFPVRGWHWGQYEFMGENLVLSTNTEALCHIRPSELIQINMGKKNKCDIVLNFKDDDERCSQQTQVTEVTFYIPPTPNDPNENIEDNEEVEDNINYLHDTLLAKSDLSTNTVTKVAFILDYLNLASPPGRFNIHVQRDCLKLYGRTAYYSVPWGQVVTMYLLKGYPSTCLFMELEKPLRKGQTLYKHVVLQFDDRKEVQIHVTLGPDDADRKVNNNPIEPEYKGREVDLLPPLLQAFGNIPVQIPKNFESASGHAYVQCSYKTNTGKLFFLDNCIVFTPKPPTIFKHEEIAAADFRRGGAARTRLFEFRIQLKNNQQEHDFQGLDRQEYDILYRYFEANNLPVRSGTLDEDVRDERENVLDEEDMEDDSEEDSDFQDEEEPDAGSSEEDNPSEKGSVKESVDEE